MKKTVLLFGLLLFGALSNAQSSLPKNVSDSLWGVWVNTEQPDSIRLKAIHRFAYQGYLFSFPDSAAYFANLELEFATNFGYKLGIANALTTMGISHALRGNNELAIACFSKSLEIFRQINNKKGIASGLINLGNLSYFLSDYIKAIDYYMNSLSFATESQNHREMAASYSNIGSCFYFLGNIPETIKNYALSQEFYKKSGDNRGLAEINNNLGNVYREQGLYKEAIDQYFMSKLIYQNSGYEDGVGQALLSIGWAYYEMGYYDTAFAYLEDALVISKKVGNMRQIALCMNNLGCTYFELGNVKMAKQILAEALEMSKTSELNEYVSGTVIPLIIVYCHTSDLDSAKVYLDILYQNKQKDLSVNYFALTEQNKPPFFARLEVGYNIYYEFTMFYNSNFPGLADTAFNLSMQNKGLALKSSTILRTSILNSADTSLLSDYDRWIIIRTKIAEYYSQGLDTKSLESESAELEKDLIRRSDAFSDFDKIKNLDWKQVRDGLKEGEAAIEFVHFKSEIDTANPIVYAAFVVRPNSEHPDVVKLCTEDDLKTILGVLQGNNLSFIEKVYGKKTEAKKDLYQKIWQPLEPYLEDVKTVYYSPSGLLHKVSFASICKEQDVYLSDVYNFRQMGSTGNLAFENKTEFGELENFLLMGGVNYNSDSTEKKVWDYLPGSLSETNIINNYLQKKKFGVNYFKEGNASEEIFKEKITSSSIVHIATHGFFFPDPEQVREEMKADSESNQDLKFRGTTNYANWSFVNNKNPLMRSGIVLAGANDVWERDALAEGEDGILTAQEVSNLDLRNTKLVVLSACETGLGDIKGSEGVFGLQRAFKMAGVKYLIMSLWQVPDKETSEFMILFYKNLIKEKDIPVAFQKTQKVMREKYDPYYWGAFVLIE